MRAKICFLLIALLIPGLLFPAAASAEALPITTEAPIEYRLFPAPEDAYVGDVMPFVTEDGALELYYLYDTDHNGQGYHPIYKYVTKNLYEYEDHGLMLNFGQMNEPDPALGTGSVMQDRNGLYHLFYTGHNDTGNNGNGKECVMHATSTDREIWTKHPEDTFFSPENYSKDDFRDPEVFWVESDQCYWLLIAARENALGGVVAKYTSTDLKNWDFCGPIFAPQAQYMLECPDLFCMGETWYLTYSWDCVTYYAIGESMNGPFTAPEDNILDGKNTLGGDGFIFYAAKTAEWQDHVYLCGWIGRAGQSVDSAYYQWAGNGLNHQLVQHDDKTLGVTVPENYFKYFTSEKNSAPELVAGKADITDSAISLIHAEDDYALVDLGERLPSALLECDVTLDADGFAGFAFGYGPEDPDWKVLCLDARRDQIHYEGMVIPELSRYEPEATTRFDFSPDTTYHVTLVCDDEIVVLYIDNAKALSSRIGHALNDGGHLGIFADQCDARFSNMILKAPALQ